MRRSLCAGVVCCVLLPIVVSVPMRAAERPASEHQKIEALLQHVEHLTDAVCIRNNQAYNAKTAAKFLRAK